MMTVPRQVYLSGRFVPEAEARVSIFDSALMFGDMAFEMTRTYNHQPFRLSDHLERLYVGLKLLEIDCGLTIDEMTRATFETIEVNRPCFPKGLDFQIMHDVSRGPLGLYASVFPEGLRPTVTINCWPLIGHLGPFAEAYEKGVHAVIPRQRSVPAQFIDPKVKNRSRVYYQVANLQAKAVDPHAWALLTDDQGLLTEGTGANFFLVRGGELLTPEPRNILRGVTRKALMELAGDLGVPCRECNLEPYDVLTAEEAFFTSTTYAVIPVTRYCGHVMGEGVTGPMTRRLIAAWSEMVGLDIVAQAKQYAEGIAR